MPTGNILSQEKWMYKPEIINHLHLRKTGNLKEIKHPWYQALKNIKNDRFESYFLTNISYDFELS